MASSFGWNSGCLCSASASTRRRIAPAMNAPRIASNPRCVARAPRPTTSSSDSRTRIWAEVSASLLIILVIHIERSMRSVPITTRTTRTPSSDSSSSLELMAVVRPREEEGEQNDRGELAERGAGDRELADWTVGHTCVLQDGNDQAQRRGHENDPNEQRAFGNARCVEHDAD